MAAWLPLEVITDVLAWLPVKSLLRFKCVSKEWFNLINNPSFIKLHLQRSHVTKRSLAFIKNNKCTERMTTSCLYILDDDIDSPDPNPTQPTWLRNIYEWIILIDSCNGLLCFTTTSETNRIFHVCNPSMRTFKEVIMEDPPLSSGHPGLPFWGFGYDSENDEYKIVVMVFKDGVAKDMFVYRLKQDLWRRCPSHVVKHVCDFNFSTGSPTRCMNNRLHGIVWSKNQETSIWQASQISRLNLSLEEWDEFLNLPTYSTSDNLGCMELSVLHGHLCLTLLAGRKTVHVWVMNEYGVQESWTKLFSVSRSKMHLKSFGNPISYSKDGTKILVSTFRRSGLSWYHPDEETMTEFDMIDKQGRRRGINTNFILYTQSLVSISPTGRISASSPV